MSGCYRAYLNKDGAKYIDPQGNEISAEKFSEMLNRMAIRDLLVTRDGETVEQYKSEVKE